MNKKNTIRFTESELKRVITESVNRILNEVQSQYQQPHYLSQSIDDSVSNIEASVQREKVFTDNMKYFANGYKIVAQDYPIIKTLKRSAKVGEIARDIISVKSFLKYVEHIYGEDLYTTSFEGYGDNEEIADMFLQSCVITLRKPDVNVNELYEKLGLRAPLRYRDEL